MRRRTRIPARVGLALAAVACALAVVPVAARLSGSDSDVIPAETDPISATGTLEPRIVLFGDTVTASVDVVLDREVVDPGGVRVTWSHDPWNAVALPRTDRRDSGSTTYLRTTFTLRCLTVPCVPVRETETVELEPAEVTYGATVGDGTRRTSLDVPWRPLVVHTRIAEVGTAQRDALAAPWRADFLTLPAVSYRAAPILLLALLVAAGGLLLALAAVIAYRALPEREAPPEPEPPPPPVVSPLEQALALLESTTHADGAHGRRRALELVAEEVERWGDDDLALRARTLAWSEDMPDRDETRALAAHLRSELDRVDRELERASELERTNGVPA